MGKEGGGVRGGEEETGLKVQGQTGRVAGAGGRGWELAPHSLTGCRQFPIVLLGSGQAGRRAGEVRLPAVLPR